MPLTMHPADKDSRQHSMTEGEYGKVEDALVTTVIERLVGPQRVKVSLDELDTFDDE